MRWLNFCFLFWAKRFFQLRHSVSPKIFGHRRRCGTMPPHDEVRLPLRPDQFIDLCSELATRLQPHPLEHAHTVIPIAGLCADSYIDLCTSLAAQYSPPTCAPPLDERLQRHRSEQAARFAKRTDLLLQSQALPPVPSLGSSTSRPWKSDPQRDDGSPSRGRKSRRRVRPQRTALGALRGAEVNERDDVMDANAQPASSDATPPHLRLLQRSSCSPPRKKRAPDPAVIQPRGQADPLVSQPGWSVISRPVVQGGV